VDLVDVHLQKMIRFGWFDTSQLEIMCWKLWDLTLGRAGQWVIQTSVAPKKIQWVYTVD
jgi:hypothetical protein